ncbi:MAG: hypothetical protein H0X70_11315 [Segetibacter sp.]|nr:hypothetical protein [Segetibacter sp.]
MTKTLIELVGETLDIEDLKCSLGASPWQIIKDSDVFYLTSEILNKFDDTNEVISTGKIFLDLLNGTANIVYINHKNVTTGSVIKIDENGKRAIHVFVEPLILGSRLGGSLIAKGKTIPKLTIVEEWLNKAAKYESVRDAIHFFNEITWWNLYKIYEVICEDVGGQHKLKPFLNLSEIKTFTHNADNRRAIGDQARHASKKYDPPKKKLTLDEAYELIKQLFEKWVNTKV